jgi:hypothetical protein
MAQRAFHVASDSEQGALPIRSLQALAVPQQRKSSPAIPQEGPTFPEPLFCVKRLISETKTKTAFCAAPGLLQRAPSLPFLADWNT